MRSTIVVLAAVVGLSAFAGCTNSPKHLNGTAEPVGGIVPTSSLSPVRAAVASPSASVQVSVPARSGQTDPTGRTPAVQAPTGLVLGPNGLGKLTLGMSFTKAMKTGLLTGDGPTTAPTGCTSAFTPKSAHGADAPVFFNGSRGLVSFTAYPGLSTPQGIKLGSTGKAVLKAYPDWSSVTGPGPDGRGYAKVPGGSSNAVYNISISGGKVVHINLQLRDQGCYE